VTPAPGTDGCCRNVKNCIVYPKLDRTIDRASTAATSKIRDFTLPTCKRHRQRGSTKTQGWHLVIKAHSFVDQSRVRLGNRSADGGWGCCDKLLTYSIPRIHNVAGTQQAAVAVPAKREKKSPSRTCIMKRKHSTAGKEHRKVSIVPTVKSNATCRHALRWHAVFAEGQPKERTTHCITTSLERNTEK